MAIVGESCDIAQHVLCYCMVNGMPIYLRTAALAGLIELLLAMIYHM